MTDTDAELRALQARAYGRDADIAADPAALDRLRALEKRSHEVPAIRSAPAAPLATMPTWADSDDAAPARTSSGIAPEIDGTPDRVSATPPSRTDAFLPRPRVAWFVVAAAAIAVTAAVSTAVTASARPTEPGVVDTIAVDTSGDWWEALGEQTDGSVLFDDYYGITFVRNEGWTPIDDQRCLLGVSTEMLASSSGDFGFGGLGMGCSAGAFPASVQFTIASGSPDALRDRFPDGTSLKFTLRGDTVEVRADRTPAAES